jgi:RHS repeat-associated protein
MERDSESGMQSHGVRYYAPWLARWTSTDPAGMTDGSNLYCALGNSPLVWTDREGTDLEVSPFQPTGPAVPPRAPTSPLTRIRPWSWGSRGGVETAKDVTTGARAVASAPKLGAAGIAGVVVGALVISFAIALGTAQLIGKDRDTMGAEWREEHKDVIEKEQKAIDDWKARMRGEPISTPGLSRDSVNAPAIDEQPRIAPQGQPNAPQSTPGAPGAPVVDPSPAGPAISASGNRKTSKRMQVVYGILQPNGTIHKFGISGGATGPNHKREEHSKRTLRQVRKLGPGFESIVLLVIPSGPGARRLALAEEKALVDEYMRLNPNRKGKLLPNQTREGFRPPGNKRP